MSTTNPVAPCDFVVFGGTGDLAVRKLLPALYLRDRDGQLPAETRIIAASRAGLDVCGYRDKVRAELGRFHPPQGYVRLAQHGPLLEVCEKMAADAPVRRMRMHPQG